MPSVIDELTIAFKLDPTQFNAGQKKVLGDIENVEKQADKTGRKMEESGKRAAGFYDEITKSVLGLIGAVAGADVLGTFAVHTTQADAALGRTAQTLDMSAASLSRWEGAARRAGAAGGSVTAAFQNISQQIQRFQLGELSALVARAAQLGVTLSDGNGKPLSADQIYENFAEKMQGMDPARALAIGREIGMPDDQIPILLRGRGGIEGLLSEQDKIGHTTQADVDAATNLNKDLVALDETTHRIGEQLLTDFSPAIDNVVKKLEAWAEWLSAWIDKHPEEAKLAAGGAAAAGVLVGGSAASNILRRLLGGGAAAGAGAGLGLGGAALGAGVLALSGDTAGGGISDAEREAYNKKYDALPDDQKFWARIKNGIKKRLFPGAYIRDKLISMGHSPEEASAIAANAIAESGGDANAEGDNGAAYGLFQLHADRQAAFKKFIGKDIRDSSIDEQLRFMDEELRTTELRSKAILDKTSGAGAKAAVYSLYNERPGDAAGEATKRAGYGNDLMDDYLKSIRPQTGSDAGAVSATHTEVHIGKVDVHTQSHDADGIARDFSGAVSDYISAAQANAGLA